MKKPLFFLVFILIILNSFAQKFNAGIYAGTFWDNGINTFLVQKNTYVYSLSSYHFNAGFDVSMKVSKNLSLLTGYDFSYRYLEVNLFSNNPVNSFSGTDIYTNSIPLLLEYRYENPSWSGKSVFVRAGGGLEAYSPEYSVFGTYATENISTLSFKYGLFYTIDTPKNPLPFIQGSIGFGDKLGKNGNISLGLSYKLLLSDFSYNLYYYFSDYTNPPVESTFTLKQKLSDISIDAAYSFGFNKRRSE